MSLTRRLLIVIPALVLAGASVIVAETISGSPHALPEGSQALLNTPAQADLVAPASDGLSTVAVSRDWREVLVSPKRK